VDKDFDDDDDLNYLRVRPRHGSGSQSPASHGGFTHGSVHVGFMVDEVAPGQVFSEFFGFSLFISFHRGCPYSSTTWGMNNRSDLAVVQRRSLAPSTRTTTFACKHELLTSFSVLSILFSS
jgi:hypothetical protein